MAFEKFEIKVEQHLARPYTGVMGFGSCFPTGTVRASDEFHLQDREGRRYPLAWRPLVTTNDGFVEWAYFSFPVQLGKREFKHFCVVPGTHPVNASIEIKEGPGTIHVRNGEDEILFDGSSPLGLGSLERGGFSFLQGGNAAAEMVFQEGTYRLTEPMTLSIESVNSFEVVIRAAGKLLGENDDAIELRLRYKVALGKPGLDINAYFSNRRESDEELMLQSFRLSFDLAYSAKSCFIRQNAEDNFCLPRDYEIPGDISIRHNRLVDSSAIQIPERAELWPFLKRYDREQFFSSVAPYAGVRGAEGGAVFGWQRSTHLGTGSFVVDGQTAILELVSSTEEGRRIPQGFSRSFDFSISSFAGEISSEEIYWLAAIAEYSPLISVHPEWYIENGIEEMDRQLPYRPDLHPRYEKQLWREYAIGYHGGFYHSGDYPSARGIASSMPVLPPYTWNNNEEDHVKGLGWMLMRTGDPSYREDLQLCLRHLLEVDRVAFSRHAIQNGIFTAHARHHFDGPGYPSHCWAEGVLLAYKLLGEADALDAFLKLCDCLLQWVHTPDAMRFSDAREMGVPVTNFANAYKLTGETKYLDAARIYIREFRKQMDEGGLYYKKGAHSIAYAEYVAVEGLWDYYELAGIDENEKVEIVALLLEIIEWIWRVQIDAAGVYDARSTSESFLHIFYIAYRLTDNEVWLERGRRGLDAALSQSAHHPHLKFNNNGAFYTEAVRRGWFRDELVPLEPCLSSRAVNRHYSEPTFGWEKLG